MWKVEKIIKKGDYLYALVPLHPNATKDGYVLEHRVRIENHLGRLLNKAEIVHHVDGNGHNNRLDNLVVVSAIEHRAIHDASRSRAWVILKCPHCKSTFSKEKRCTFLVKGGKATFCSKRCSAAFNRRATTYGLTTEMKSAISENLVSEFKKKFSDDNAEETTMMGSVETTRTPPETVKT